LVIDVRVEFFSKGPVDQVSGGFLYNRKLIEYLRKSGICVEYQDDPALLETPAVDRLVIIDSLVLASAAAHLSGSPLRPALLLHMLPPGTGQSFSDLLLRSHVVVTGEITRRQVLETAGGGSPDVTLIEPGVDAGWVARRDYGGTAKKLLCVANYVAGKGHARLLHALRDLASLDWELKILGNADIDPACFAAVARLVTELGLQERVQVCSAVPHDRVRDAMMAADLLLQFSEFESYSIVTAEAIACGLPVLMTRTGNWPVFSRSGLVRVLQTGGVEESRSALHAIITNPADYGELRPAGSLRPRSWDDVGADFLSWLRRIQ
jgi:glycosyltransferase involved in cell wall biosynthesis